MCELTAKIVTHLLSQPGILPYLMRKHSSLEKRVAAWLTGERSILIIGGEPGHGKSLLMGELALRYSELVKLHATLLTPLILISYDRVHCLFLQRLAQIHTPNLHTILPEGETHPEARRYISQILRDLLLFAFLHFPKKVPIVLEAPLIDYRGEDLVDELSSWGIQMQIFIMHSPAMWERVMHQGKQLNREMISAQALAMHRIHETLLCQRGVVLHPQQAQDQALIKSWEQWLGQREGLILSWDPADDEAGFAHTMRALKTMCIRPDPLTPNALNRYTLYLIEVLLEMMPDPRAFAAKVQEYRS